VSWLVRRTARICAGRELGEGEIALLTAMLGRNADHLTGL
jgi:hypothetical protein